MLHLFNTIGNHGFPHLPLFNIHKLPYVFWKYSVAISCCLIQGSELWIVPLLNWLPNKVQDPSPFFLYLFIFFWKSFVLLFNYFSWCWMRRDRSMLFPRVLVWKEQSGFESIAPIPFPVPKTVTLPTHLCTSTFVFLAIFVSQNTDMYAKTFLCLFIQWSVL